MTGRPVFASSGVFDAPDLVSVLELASGWGVTHIELSSGVPYAKDLVEVVRSRRSEFRFLVHNYFPPPPNPFVLNIASSNPAVLKSSIDHCLSAIRVAAELGAPFYSVHAGYALDPKITDLGRPLEGVSAGRQRAYEKIGRAHV
jgi:sugar phosphate isomerase/epimerase